jgi:hypothetical protein
MRYCAGPSWPSSWATSVSSGVPARPVGQADWGHPLRLARLTRLGWGQEAVELRLHHLVTFAGPRFQSWPIDHRDAAIGLFTKIALKNQVDDLLNQFRAYYQGSVKTTLAQLRQRYDLLLLKVLSLLQDSDQALATAIGASREALWGILADRQKFATI